MTVEIVSCLQSSISPSIQYCFMELYLLDTKSLKNINPVINISRGFLLIIHVPPRINLPIKSLYSKAKLMINYPDFYGIKIYLIYESTVMIYTMLHFHDFSYFIFKMTF